MAKINDIIRINETRIIDTHNERHIPVPRLQLQCQSVTAAAPSPVPLECEFSCPSGLVPLPAAFSCAGTLFSIGQFDESIMRLRHVNIYIHIYCQSMWKGCGRHSPFFFSPVCLFVCFVHAPMKQRAELFNCFHEVTRSLTQGLSDVGNID